MEAISFDFSVLRELRRREGLTLAKVAQRAQVSAPVISKLERNQTRAELETLFRLARVFGLTVADLIALAESRTAQVKHATRHQAGPFEFEEIRYGNIRCLWGRARKGASLSRPEVHRDDYEICWVLEGRLRVTLAHEQHELTAGDAIQFDAVWAHQYEALDDCRVLLVHLGKGKRF